MAIIGKITSPSIADNYVVDVRTLTALEDTNRQMQLTFTPSDPTKVTLDLIGGTSQVRGLDFDIIGDVLTWNGFSLETVLAAGDKIRIIFPL